MSKIARKHFLVLPSYQIRLVGFMTVIMFFGALVHGYFLFRITSKDVGDSFLSAHNRLRSTWEVLKRPIIVTNGLSFIIVSISFVLISILISHRLIGPMFKIASRIKDMTLGRFDLDPVKLRKGDEGKILSDAVNRLSDDMNMRFSALKKLRDDIEKARVSDMGAIVQNMDAIMKDIKLRKSGSE